MAALLKTVELHAREEDAPDQFRVVVKAGWVTDGDAHLLTALKSGYSGAGRTEFADAVHFEAAVNGRGMMDHDLPTSGPERLTALLRRSLGYACTALRSVPPGRPWPTLAYISLSAGGLDDDVLTAHVTFCSDRPDVPPYVADVESYEQEALMELSQEDAAALLRK
ncbi:hypothetical protein [Streptomyces sp. NPDC001536]|uniref:hypothetical protein n=1 Tax=Streptomyces sp. NPDC001536 TaxID=3364583 RepID=UPI0036A4B7DC